MRNPLASLLGALAGAALILLLAAAARAMPVETRDYRDVPGVTADGELDIHDVLDNATEMDVRLTKQIMLLQRQINQLKREIEELEAKDR